METSVILGSGQAGAYAAISMRRAGYGGRIVLVGDEPELPYDRSLLSKAYMLGRENKARLFFAHAAYSDHQVELRLGEEALEIDAEAGKLRLRTGVLDYDRLVLATGSMPRQLSVPGGEGVAVLRTRRDADRIRARLTPGTRVVCVGAGVIGLEIAAAAATLGCLVRIVELAGTVMSRSLMPEFAAIIASSHERAGIRIEYGAELSQIDGGFAHLADGRRIEGDLFIAGIGVVRNTQLAQAAGLDVQRGVITDAHGRSSVETIYAAGEIAEIYSARLGRYQVHESWRHAQDHGTFVGRAVAGHVDGYDEIPWFWSDQFDRNYQIAGDVSQGDRVVYRGDPHAESFSAFVLDGSARVTGAIGVNAGRDVAAAMRLIRRNAPVDPRLIADQSITPQKLVSSAPLETVQGTP